MSRSGIDWGAVRRRLEESRLALERALAGDPERTAEVFRRRARELAGRRARAAGPAATVRALTFRLGAERYALPLADLAGLLPLAGCVPVPGGPPELVGVLNVRGALRSVVDLGRLLGLPPGEAGGYVLLLRRGGGPAAVRVDRVDAIEGLPAEALAAPPESAPGAAARLVRGVAPGGLALLDAAAVLAHPAWGAASA